MPSLRMPLVSVAAGLTLLAGIGGAVIAPALAQERERGYERRNDGGGRDLHRERRFDRDERERREYRERDYGYDVPSYGVVPPPLVYSPPPPPPGINFLFTFH